MTRLPDDLRHAAALASWQFLELPDRDRNPVVGPEGRYMRIGPDRQSIPILDTCDDDGPRAILIPLDDSLMDRVETIIRLHRLMKGLDAPDGRLTPAQRLRLRHMLQAVDGDDHGATASEIAEVIFGRSRDKGRAWHESTFRFKVNRLIRDGRLMIDHGYRFLLRPKRKR